MTTHDDHKGTGPFPNAAMLGNSREDREELEYRVYSECRVEREQRTLVAAVPTSASQCQMEGQEVPFHDGVRQDT